jgi:hypothetical protein
MLLQGAVSTTDHSTSTMMTWNTADEYGFETLIYFLVDRLFTSIGEHFLGSVCMYPQWCFYVAYPVRRSFLSLERTLVIES